MSSTKHSRPTHGLVQEDNVQKTSLGPKASQVQVEHEIGQGASTAPHVSSSRPIGKPALPGGEHDDRAYRGYQCTRTSLEAN